MMFLQLAFIPIIIFISASVILLSSPNWRLNIGALAAQAVGVFWLVAASWPLGLALVDLVVGLVCAVVIASTQPKAAFEDAQIETPSGIVFRVMAVGLSWLLVLAINPAVSSALRADPTVTGGGLVMICSGLVQLGMTTRPIRVVVGLFCILWGFEILYAIVESSVLVTGLIALINLGLAFVGVYMTPPQHPEEAV